MTFTVYSHRDADDRVLYIGQTGNLAARTRAHSTKAPWWPQVARVAVEGEYVGRSLARMREANLIHTLRPPNNRYGSKATQWMWYERSLIDAMGLEQYEEFCGVVNTFVADALDRTLRSTA